MDIQKEFEKMKKFQTSTPTRRFDFKSKKASANNFVDDTITDSQLCLRISESESQSKQNKVPSPRTTQSPVRSSNHVSNRVSNDYSQSIIQQRLSRENVSSSISSSNTTTINNFSRNLFHRSPASQKRSIDELDQNDSLDNTLKGSKQQSNHGQNTYNQLLSVNILWFFYKKHS